MALRRARLALSAILVLALLVVAGWVTLGPRHIADVYPAARTVRLFVVQYVSPKSAEDRVTEHWINPPGGYRLTAQQTTKLRRAMLSIRPRQAAAACFVPHHFFRFYDAAGRQVGEISVCFCCGGAGAIPEIAVGRGRILDVEYDTVKTLVTAIGANADVDCEH